PIRDDPIDHFDAARRTDPAWRAFAAGFDRAKFHREACLLRHIDAVVERDDAAVAEHALDRGERFVVDRRIELRFGQIRTERSADLYRADRPPARRTAAVAVQPFA